MKQLMRQSYDNLDISEKNSLLQQIAEHYGMTVKEYITFSRYGKELYTAIFSYIESEFVFVPGDTVTLGWDDTVKDVNEYTRQGFEYMLKCLGEEMDIDKYLSIHTSPIRKTTIKPMLVERDYFQLGSIFYDDITDENILHSLDVQGLAIPTLNEWEYLCSCGSRKLFPWGNDFNKDMHFKYFSSRGSEPSYILEQPNLFGLFIGYDPYEQELVRTEINNSLVIKGGDGGVNICGGMGVVAGYFSCSPYFISDSMPEKNPYIDYNIRRVLHIDLSKPVILLDDENVPLMDKILYLHDTNQHQKIVDTIISLTEEERNDYAILGRLACAYNNLSKYENAIDIMLEIKEEGEKDWLWNYRMGYAYYFQYKEHEAEIYFRQAVSLNPQDDDCWWFLANLYHYYIRDEIKLAEALDMLENCNPEMYKEFIGGIEISTESSKASEYDIDITTYDCYKFDENKILCNDSEFPSDYVFCKDMIDDPYFPKELVMLIQDKFRQLVNWLRSSSLTYKEIQERMDEIIIYINDLEEEFYAKDSEIETVARESIGETVGYIFDWYQIDISVECAMRERNW